MVDQQPRNLLDQQAIDALTAGRNFLANVTSEGTQSLAAEYEENVKKYAGELLTVLESREVVQWLFRGYDDRYYTLVDYGNFSTRIAIVQKRKVLGINTGAYYVFEASDPQAKVVERAKNLQRFKSTPYLERKYGGLDIWTVYVHLTPEDFLNPNFNGVLPDIVKGSGHLFGRLNKELERDNSKNQHNLALLRQANEILGDLK